MNARLIAFAGIGLLLPAVAAASDAEIESAMSAGPSSISAYATIKDWDGNVLREGSNGWTCLPDIPDTPGVDPWCVDHVWAAFLDAFAAGEQPEYSQVGLAYMLQGDTGVSNIDPYATEPTEDNDWVDGLGAHMMMLVPGEHALDGMSTDPQNGGPWVMWPDTPYRHVMIPIESYGRDED